MMLHKSALAVWASVGFVVAVAQTVDAGAAARAPERVRLVVQLGHQRAVCSVAFSPNGKQVLTCSWDTTARLWDAASGKELRTFEGHTNSATCAVFSPDGKTVLTGSWDHTARLWDTVSGRELRKFEGHAGPVRSVAFSPDGQQALSGGDDKTARLWDVASGKQLRSFEGHTLAVFAVAFSPDGSQVLSGSDDQTARSWDARRGQELRRFLGHARGVWSVAFSPNGSQVLSGSLDHTARLWDAASGQELRKFERHADGVRGIAFSPDGKQVLSGGDDGIVRLWDAASGKAIRTFEGHQGIVLSVAFSRDGKTVLTGGIDWTARLWDAADGKEIRKFQGQTYYLTSVAFSPDGKQLLTGSLDQTARLWDAASGAEIRKFDGHTAQVTSVAFSRDGKQVLTSSADRTARLWDSASGKHLRTFAGHTRSVASVAFSPDGKQILTGSEDKTARLWDAASGKELRRLEGHSSDISSVAFSPDGKQALTGSDDKTARLWDAASGRPIQQFEGHTARITSVACSPDGKQVLSGSADASARLWDAASGRELRRLDGFGEWINAVVFSPDGKQIVTAGWGPTARLWDAGSGKPIRQLEGRAGVATSAAFSPDGQRVLTGNFGGTALLLDAATGEQLCSLVSFTGGGWAVVDPQGRFDAAHGGHVDGLHWVIGDEPIDLAQLKERYYEPGLLAKKLGFDRQPLRSVESFNNPKLYPDVKLLAPGPNRPKLGIQLANRGGGIGRVVVRINGKELTPDARAPRPDPDAQQLTLDVPLPPDQPLLVPGRPNRIEVEAYNAEGYLRSRGLDFVYEPPAAAPPEPPRMWVVVSGVSSYRSPSLELRFAAKDADDFATAVGIGARRLLGRERVHLTRLTTSQADPRQRPTRDNLLAAFRAIREAKAKSTDILVVYLAGHGVNYGGQDGDFYYLTCDAQSADLSDPAVRQSVAISGQEITELIKSVPALKQVLVLDTCASGKLLEKLTEKRDVPTSQVRALERLKDRTGMHVLAGCAADAVSYEATRYGQGVLTYSLLLGMRGAALREEQFVDVDTLFGFATDKVPELAHDIGGIQRPVFAVPKAGASFEIGQLSGEDRQQIPLQPARPLMLRSVFQDEQSFDDVLGLSKRVDELLRNTSVRGSKGGVVFVDARELPDGYRLAGRYTTSAGQTTLTARLFRDRRQVTEFTTRAAAERPDELAQRIVVEVQKRIDGNVP